ncbi:MULTISPECIES: arsenic transporter [Paenibacillus]|uniref:Arsenic transporter n=1 Tax=Paenibacillus violae TaxID=3077234 RepID=A0ABU3RAZ7_9BACL|nr:MULTISPECIES: arsenic transporter [Paenibacillus]MDU0201431.1 arsenic transporter [Paenibacillus sp. PFR10]MEC0269336.1 arsenic transporter [Paenibacillus anseongense]
MVNLTTAVISMVFVAVTVLIIWRPFGINESIPTSIGALILIALGIVSLPDVYHIGTIVSGASITILSTIVMSIVLESIGIFRWAAVNLAIRAKGSGRALFWYVNILCFLMTMFFNNDGSILITTPIIIQTLTILNLKTRQKIPYLISGALVATGASAPIGVSNLANLIALKTVGLDLNTYTAMMFVPAMVGIIAISYLLFVYFKREIPVKIMDLHPKSINSLMHSESGAYHPLKVDPMEERPIDWVLFRICIFIVILIRCSFFLLTPFGIPTEWPAIVGAILLIAIRWKRRGTGPKDILLKTPWHILIFAFSIYVIIYGLHNSGLTQFIVSWIGETVAENHFNAIFGMGILLTVMSNLCNNLPSVMIGSLSLQSMGLDTFTLHTAYLGNVIGADIGSLLLPMGTLASLIWMHILKRHNIHLTWGQYIKVTILVVPIALFLSLFSLYVWTGWLFK